MKVLQGFTWLLLAQSVGELIARGAQWPLPGPVIGVLLMLPLLHWPPVRDSVGAAADALLAHLSLLFVPVGVGVISHLDLIAHHGLRLLVVLVVSTLVGLAATAWVLQWLGRGKG